MSRAGTTTNDADDRRRQPSADGPAASCPDDVDFGARGSGRPVPHPGGRHRMAVS